MQEASSRGIVLSWDPKKRIAELRFERETAATGEDARILVAAIRSWIGTEKEPFALLGDGGKLSGLDAEYRSIWAGFLRENRDQIYIAFYNMNPVVRIAADMFRIGAGLNLKVFGDREEDARAWLRKQGIDA